MSFPTGSLVTDRGWGGGVVIVMGQRQKPLRGHTVQPGPQGPINTVTVWEGRARHVGPATAARGEAGVSRLHVPLHVQRQVVGAREGAVTQVALEGPVARVLAVVARELI